MKTTKNFIFFLVYCVIITFPQICYAQEEPKEDFVIEVEFLTLEELMNLEMTVASKKGMSMRESPGIVTLVTKEEIQNSGARDLIDLLRLVAGIDFGMDVQGTIGASIRGNWGHDGKILMMIDGLSVNELAYSTTQFGNHYSVDQIEKIEIIRGPGSSIYGGNAELGVINIITKQGSDLNGFSISGTYGVMENDFGRRNVNVSLGRKINDVEYSIHGFFGQGNRSDRTFTDIFGNKRDLTNNGSVINPTLINAALCFKDLSFRFIYDNYNNKSYSLWDESVDSPIEMKFESLLGEIKYNWMVNDKLIITPKLYYADQKPWYSTDKVYQYDINTTRLDFNVSASYDVDENINLMVGGGYYRDKGKKEIDVFYNNSGEFTYSNISAFAQAVFKTEYVNFTFGGRYDNHSEVEAAFSPRIALTKAFDKFHYKLLYSHAFRSPGIENMNLAHKVVGESYENIAPEIKPEKTKVVELEFGYKVSSNMVAMVNVFNTIIDDPIVYFFYEGEEGEIIEGYFNDTKAGTRGFEIDYRIKDDWGYSNVNYTYYTTNGINEMGAFEVPGNEDALLAFPQHKISFNGSYKITEAFTINPSVVYRSKRNTYRALDLDEVEVLSEEDPIILLNIYFNFKNLFKGFTIGAGVYDVFGANDEFFQAYNSWHSPWPGPSREFLLKLTYDFNFGN